MKKTLCKPCAVEIAARRDREFIHHFLLLDKIHFQDPN